MITSKKCSKVEPKLIRLADCTVGKLYYANYNHLAVVIGIVAYRTQAGDKVRQFLPLIIKKGTVANCDTVLDPWVGQDILFSEANDVSITIKN